MKRSMSGAGLEGSASTRRGFAGVKGPICACLAAITLAACATRPDSIRASFVSHEKFMDLECPQLEARLV